MKSRLFVYWICFVSTSFAIHAQDTDKRFSFAETYFGLESIYIPSYGSSYFINEDNAVEAFTRHGRLSPGLNFGATHFWGHADFYISIPVGSINLNADRIDNELAQRVLTGLRIYPWKIGARKWRPFFGYKFSAHQYEQSTIDNQTAQHTQVKSIFDVGIGYQTPLFYLYAGYNRILNPDFDIYISRDYNVSVSYPSAFFNVGMNIRLEFTSSERTEALENLMDELGSTNNFGFFFGIGPSSAFPLGNSPRISNNQPFLDQQVMPGIFPDLSMGYHFSKWDLITNLAFRPITQKREALDFSQTVKRRSLTLEVLKGLGDYHGFVPFLGMGLSYENIGLEEKDEGAELTNSNYQKATPLFCFGWDIRPNRAADWLILRTNLRYAPFLDIEEGRDEINLDQLEFNFIQVVVYPYRRSKYKG